MKTFDALLREAFEAGWNQANAQLLPMDSEREQAYKKWRRELPTSGRARKEWVSDREYVVHDD